MSVVSQSFHTGASILGLTAWHLYPDILVLAGHNKHIKQNDHLVPPGTIATLGLQDREIRSTENNGVFWSLPLACLQFYSDPVQAVGSVEGESGLNIDQLMQVALGSFLGQWVHNYADFPSASYTLVLMSKLLPDHYKANWLKSLADAAKNYLESTGIHLEECSRLLKSGRRRYPNFLSEKRHWTSPFLGLTKLNNLLDLCPTPEDRIGILRNAAVKYGEVGHRMVIRYKSDRFGRDGQFECATVLPVEISHRGTKRTKRGVRDPGTIHIRWVEGSDGGTDDSHCQAIRDLGEEVVKLPVGSIWEGSSAETDLKWTNAPSPFARQMPDRRTAIEIATQFDFILGEPTSAALYVVGDENVPVVETLPVDDLQQTFQENRICPYKFAEYLEGFDQMKETSAADSGISKCIPTIRSARALCVVAEVYRHLQGARIAIKVADKPLHTTKWAMIHRGTPEGIGGRPNGQLSFAQTFACIASFESGFIDIDPDSLEHVMAMSTGSSIYIAEPLLSDPADRRTGGKVKRVVGNVGRAGIAMLMAPRNPRMRTLDHNTWNHVNHNNFDGKLEDCFQHTTLHLSFTDWEMPIDVGAHGARDCEVFFLEAPISIHHRGEWIADIDIFNIFSSRDLALVCLPGCVGHEGKSIAEACKEIAAQQLVAIDS